MNGIILERSISFEECNLTLKHSRLCVRWGEQFSIEKLASIVKFMLTETTMNMIRLIWQIKGIDDIDALSLLLYLIILVSSSVFLFDF